MAEATAGSLEISAKDRAFRADAGRPTARNQSGQEYQATTDLRHQLSDTLLLTGTLGWKEISARQSLHSNREWEFAAGLTMSHAAPFSLTAQPWTSSLTAAYVETQYFAPDPAVDPNRNRRDSEKRLTLLTSIPVVRRLVTPRAIRRARVRRVALSQFLAHGLHMTEGRTGVLIFAAMSDHQVEVIADRGIHSRVDPDVWAGAVEVLVRGLRSNRPVEGFEQAIGLCGQVLAEQFPPGAQNHNEIADRLVVI